MDAFEVTCIEHFNPEFDQKVLKLLQLKMFLSLDKLLTSDFKSLVIACKSEDIELRFKSLSLRFHSLRRVSADTVR